MTHPLVRSLLPFAVASSVLLVACSSEAIEVPEASPGEVLVLSPEEGKALIESDQQALVIDVRPVAEYRSGHLVGAQSIDATDVTAWEFRIPRLDPERPTVVYCSDPACSATAAQDLVEQGFEAVYDMGGIDDWDDEVLQVDEPQMHRPLRQGEGHDGS